MSEPQIPSTWNLGHNFDSSPSLPALNPTFVAAKPRPKVRRLKEHLAAELGVSRFRLQLFDDNGPVEETAVIDSRHQDWSCLVSLKQFWSIFGVEGGSGIQKLRFGFITFNAFCLFHFSIIFFTWKCARKTRGRIFNCWSWPFAPKKIRGSSMPCSGTTGEG